MATILYISGHGRSGSTLLNSMLAHWTNGAGVGEVAHVAYASPPCRCDGSNCPIGAVMTDQTINERSLLARKLGWQALLLPHRFTAEARAWKNFFSQLSSHANCSTVIDASKSARVSAGRARILSRTDHRVVVIHLRRDVRAIIAAYRRGCNIKLEAGEDPHYQFPAIRAVLSWTLSNLASVLTNLLSKQATHITLRYSEMFSVDGRKRLLKYLSDAGVEVTRDEPSRETFSSYPHQTLGNRLASAEEFTLTLDDRWKN
jgi:hypothetical protein